MIINTETGQQLKKKIARRAAEIWYFEGKNSKGNTIVRRGIDPLKSEIVMEIEKECVMFMDETGENIGKSGEGEEEDEEDDSGDEDVEDEETTALGIMLQNEKIKTIVGSKEKK